MADGFEIAERIEMPADSDTVEAAVRGTGIALAGFGASFARFRPDVLLLVGDRFELFSAACAALSFRVPIGHVSGGDITEGAIDNQVRFALTKMSHLHFVAMEQHARRLLQMGEELWRVHVTGDPALDTIREMHLLDHEALTAELGSVLRPPIVMVTYHPTTLGSLEAKDEIRGVLAALERVEGTLIFTYPNADPGADAIIDEVENFVKRRATAHLFPNMGQHRYYSLMARADLLLGNSSSGLWEAATFRLPVINVGDRQRGRICPINVISVPVNAVEILGAIRQALDRGFRNSLEQLTNPYGDGYATPRIINILKTVEFGPRLLQKRFLELPVP